jgi:hypothetical protein
MPSFQLDLADNRRQIFDYDGGTQVVYMGKAQPGAKTSDSVWQIRKFTYSSSRVTNIEFANGSFEFNKVWDNRKDGTYDYTPDS